MAATFRAKVKEFDQILSSEDIDKSYFQDLCSTGIPEGQGRRSLCWKILLHYLPLKQSLWPKLLQEQRTLYKQLIEEILLAPVGTETDHPLNPNPQSQWQSFFKDNEVLLQVDKDVRRLCPDISFFSQATEYPLDAIVNNKCDRLHQRVQETCLFSRNVERKGLGVSKLALSKKKASEDYAPLNKGKEAHWEVVERILFLYAKLNPGQGYVQGMNEIIGPIYYVFASDPKKEWAEYAEADCFFCFTNLMSDIRDFFIKTLDESESGINGIMLKLKRKIKKLDPDIDQRLVSQDIRPQYFSFRWLTLMLSQEFPLPEVLRIWDSLLSDDTRHDRLLDVCAAMILLIRDQILINEFPDNMKLLQNYPPIDVQIILSKAASLTST